MNPPVRAQLITIITEAALENVLAREIEKLGARGYTVTDVRGKGSRGVRDAAWGESSNIRVEVLCDPQVANAIAEHLKDHYYQNYAMVLYISDVTVMRPEKFLS